MEHPISGHIHHPEPPILTPSPLYSSEPSAVLRLRSTTSTELSPSPGEPPATKQLPSVNKKRNLFPCLASSPYISSLTGFRYMFCCFITSTRFLNNHLGRSIVFFLVSMFSSGSSFCCTSFYTGLGFAVRGGLGGFKGQNQKDKRQMNGWFI